MMARQIPPERQVIVDAEELALVLRHVTSHHKQAAIPREVDVAVDWLSDAVCIVRLQAAQARDAATSVLCPMCEKVGYPVNDCPTCTAKQWLCACNYYNIGSLCTHCGLLCASEREQGAASLATPSLNTSLDEEHR